VVLFFFVVGWDFAYWPPVVLSFWTEVLGLCLGLAALSWLVI
jgi:hypothetical protein